MLKTGLSRSSGETGGGEPGRKGDRRGRTGRGGKSGGGSSERWKSESQRGNYVIVRQRNVGVIIL